MKEHYPYSIQRAILRGLDRYYDFLSWTEGTIHIQSIVEVHVKIENRDGVAKPEDILNLIECHQKLIRWVSKTLVPGQPERALSYGMQQNTRSHAWYIKLARDALMSNIRGILLHSLEAILDLHSKIHFNDRVATPEDTINLLKHYQGLTSMVTSKPVTVVSQSEASAQEFLDNLKGALEKLTAQLCQMMDPFKLSDLTPDPVEVDAYNIQKAILREITDNYKGSRRLHGTKLIEWIVTLHNRIENRRGVAKPYETVQLIKYHQELIQWVNQNLRPGQPLTHFQTAGQQEHAWYVESARVVLTTTLRGILLRPSTGHPDISP
ncbi:hypothetical protein PtA15_7A444 [Puccinia triticina]|uniref:Uncharacterized protein n=1 Tax=Puccinia triticina TaxID=208348 RepID=A0ABY7CNB2_9BASI|nr:uncharacterized protein PtA15_7A444 [Puccinia triticina]WAQ86716.1 hypothetical protein PtA15_7A444 [Puccinia triticina]